MRFAALASVLLASAADALPYDVVRKRELTFPYGAQKVRGVNLGGWFVLEPWITPSIFETGGGAVDEYNLCRNWGKEKCRRRLEDHWSSFIGASDLRAIASAGMNHVRIPIGYWAVDPLSGDPYVQGQIPHLDKAITWAGAAGLKVWIDLHGAPGSQNGFDNSGLRDQIGWQSTPSYVAHTKRVIASLAKKYAQPKYNNVVTAIELLNEPMGASLDMDRLRQYWMDGWGAVRDYGDIAVVIGDAFRNPPEWNGFMTSGWNNVILDTHQYQVFSPAQVAMSVGDHVAAACELGRMLGTLDKWTVTGEWSGATTDCTKWLNGVGRGARYDGTFADSRRVGSCARRYRGSVAQFSAQEKANTRRYIEAQLDAYERGAGWFFWTWKTEGSPEWELRDLLAHDVFPQPLTARQFGKQCHF